MAAKQATATATATKKVKVLTEPDLLKAPDKDYMTVVDWLPPARRFLAHSALR